MLMYNDVVENKPKHYKEFFSFIIQFHSFNSRQIDAACADYFKVIVFRKKRFVKNGTSFWFVASRN